jgi:hypothetical protein
LPRSPATVRIPGIPSKDPESGSGSESSLLRPAGFTFDGEGIAGVDLKGGYKKGL